MHRFVIFLASVALSVIVVAGVAAQGTCSDFVTKALDALSNNCGDLSRNSACYGYNNVSATFGSGLSPDAFSHPNDRVGLADLQSITTAPLDLQTSQWGIAVMKAQANLPDALPGQAVTFLLLGDVQVKTGVTQGSDMKPMQAIYFTTGIGSTNCNDVPDSSLIIQGPKNITVNMRVNGADISLSSTAVFRSTPNSTMSCGVIDGAAHVGDAGQQVAIPSGFAARVPLDASLNANGDWGGNQPIADQDAAALQVLKQLPDGVLNYTPDVPTPQEVDVSASLDSKLVNAMEPHLLRNMIRLLVAEGATPEMVAEWDTQALRDFIAKNADKVLVAATPEVTSDAQATAEAGTGDGAAPFTPDLLKNVLDALDTYIGGT
jgi:hypothetical protein